MFWGSKYIFRGKTCFYVMFNKIFSPTKDIGGFAPEFPPPVATGLIGCVGRSQLCLLRVLCLKIEILTSLALGSMSTVLVTLFLCCRFVVGTSFPLPESVEDTPLLPTDLSTHVGLAHYRCLSRCKCFALVRSQYQLFAVYAVASPTFALQKLTERALEVLTRDDLM